MNKYKIFMSARQCLIFDIFFEMNRLFPERRFFLDTNRHESFNCYLTLDNKGSLFKVKCTTFNTFYLYYGTKKIIYSTKLEELIRIIDADPKEMENGYNLTSNILKCKV